DSLLYRQDRYLGDKRQKIARKGIFLYRCTLRCMKTSGLTGIYMTDTITMYVRNVRNLGGVAGHAYFVYQHDGDPPTTVSVAPLNGLAGSAGGPATVVRGIYQD